MVQINFETLIVESRDVALTIGLHTWFVTPVRIHVQTHEVHLPTSIQNAVNNSLVVAQTACHIVICPFGTSLVKPRAVSLSKTMQIDTAPFGINKKASFHMQRRET